LFGRFAEPGRYVWPSFLTAAAFAVLPISAMAMSCEQMLGALPTTPLHDWISAHQGRIALLLRPEDKPGHSAAVAAGRCEDAEAIVAKRFQAAFPEMACFFDPKLGHAGRYYIVGTSFLDLSMCFAENELRTNLAVLKEAGVSPPHAVYPHDIDALQRDYGGLWNTVMRINGAVADMDTTCRFQDYQPACVAFARVANEAVLVKKSDDLIYFYLVRARLAGFDSVERRHLEDEVGARLTPEARALDESKARTSLAGTPQRFPGDRYPGVPEPSDD
jgi:hypothetical protein